MCLNLTRTWEHYTSHLICFWVKTVLMKAALKDQFIQKCWWKVGWSFIVHKKHFWSFTGEQILLNSWNNCVTAAEVTSLNHLKDTRQNRVFLTRAIDISSCFCGDWNRPVSTASWIISVQKSGDQNRYFETRTRMFSEQSPSGGRFNRHQHKETVVMYLWFCRNRCRIIYCVSVIQRQNVQKGLKQHRHLYSDWSKRN